MSKKMRLEKDLLGELEVPEDVYWGINTQRTLNNFNISQRKFPKVFLYALALVKRACLSANQESEIIDAKIAKAIYQTIDEMLNEGKLFDQFPIDVFQTGSGTQINMNMNEVLANRANEILGQPKGTKHPVHPNDHINRSQSSNDVIPTAMHLASVNLIQKNLMPALKFLEKILEQKIKEFKGIVKVGRTHLQDAVPIPLSTEFSVYLKQIRDELSFLPIGGTALGTGLNAPKNFDQLAVDALSQLIGYKYQSNPVKAEGISSHNTIVHVSSVLRLLALSVMKMANDIRWMGSGPRAGLGELHLPENEPGSSIMPGKINPTQSEALIQVCLQVIGNDTAISYAESTSSLLDLNVAKPVMIVNLLESISILSTGIESFVQHCLKDLSANIDSINETLSKSLMIVTRLTPIIGYEKAGEIAKKAHETGKTIKEIILEMKLEIKGDLDEILDPKKMV